MSIIVKGMKMPWNCRECEIGLVYPCYSEQHLCPLIEVPPHGRLIDADELMLRIQEYIDEYGWDVDEHGFHSEKWCAMKETEMAINDAPTVIPADKDGET